MLWPASRPGISNQLRFAPGEEIRLRQYEDRILHSASDLVNFVECPHLTTIDFGLVSGRLESLVERRTDASELVAAKGDEYERDYVESLVAAGRQVVTIAPEGALDLAEACDHTAAAMRSGAEIIYQSALLSAPWFGYADFLERVDLPSTLGGWSYEVADTKLARRVKPYFLLQLCFYTDLVASMQGVVPAHMHVVLGTRERETFSTADFLAYHRRVQDRYLAAVASANGTYPHFSEHCGLCRWSDYCDKQRLADDYLGLVAEMRRDQIFRLNARGIGTVGELARAGDALKPSRMQELTFARLRQQAELQVRQRETNSYYYELVEPEEGRGFARLPQPSPGDLFFDMEGDPFYEDGLEYLFGVTWIEDGKPRYRPFWAHDRAEEKGAFEEFMDFVGERRRVHRDLHVYHYGAYEATALKRLMGLHATREDELDDLLRNEVLVDLYQVVRQGIRISQPSYSIKKVEVFYMPDREADVTDGEDSIIQFEKWLETRDDSLLAGIERYNEEDCRSTWLLREWLIERRDETERQYNTQIPWREPPEPYTPDPDEAAEVAALRNALLAGLTEDELTAQEPRWLMAQLIDYHRREAKPGYWAYFSRLQMSEEELTEDSEARAGLPPQGRPIPLPAPARSAIHTLRFPPQEHKAQPGSMKDPQTEASVSVERVDDGRGTIEVRLGLGRTAPSALIPGEPYRTPEQRKALQRIGEDIAQRGIEGGTVYAAARDVLKRLPPRTTAVTAGSPLQDRFDLEQAKRIVNGLQESYLFVQGPPGSGKTYTGAHLILHLMAQGKRVGVTANSHKAINGLLCEIEKHAADQQFLGLKKSSEADQRFESQRDEPLIDNTYENADCLGPDLDLVAGTAWLFAREDMEQQCDYLFFDEAGQVSLADALAMSTSASNLVFLGDPLQLAQVSQAVHPPGAGLSVLEHLLGRDPTIPPNRGLFIEHTRRMHPDVCEFISSAIYSGRLESTPEMARQDLNATGELTGTGVRWHPVMHQGNTQRAPEEAELIAVMVDQLLDGATFTDSDDVTEVLSADEIMVVTPYNAQVRCLREQLPDAVEVGTVDKFQGQEAAVVFFSMATSSGEEIPRNLEFLFSRNRLNVAISRAKCLAVVVASPELLHVKCRTADQMRLVNALCRLVEVAEEQTRNEGR
jgi:predicted RecB family nuclease